jgi:hypothetical protein
VLSLLYFCTRMIILSIVIKFIGSHWFQGWQEQKFFLAGNIFARPRTMQRLVPELAGGTRLRLQAGGCFT